MEKRLICPSETIHSSASIPVINFFLVLKIKVFCFAGVERFITIC